MEKKLVLLVMSSDLGLVKSLQDRTKSFLLPILFVPCTTGEKLAELAQKYQPNAVLVDDAFVDPANAALITRLRASLAGAGETKPFFCFSVERELKDLRRVMEAGFLDIFTKPVDATLFFQKLQLAFPDHKFLKDRLLFSMEVASPMEVALEAALVNASEYGAVIRLNAPLPAGTLLPLRADLYGAPGTAGCLARVISCIPTPEQRWKYEASLMLIAPSREILSSIRTWMKQEYVRRRDTSA